MNDLMTMTPAETFRAKASGAMVDAANMTLHQLLDEFMRLTEVMDANIVQEDGRSPHLNGEGELASRDRKLINGAARIRFGVLFVSFDRPSTDIYDQDF